MADPSEGPITELLDLALAADEFGAVMVHRADCPVVRALAERGEMVFTMFGCERCPKDIQRHECLRAASGNSGGNSGGNGGDG